MRVDKILLCMRGIRLTSTASAAEGEARALGRCAGVEYADNPQTDIYLLMWSILRDYST